MSFLSVPSAPKLLSKKPGATKSADHSKQVPLSAGRGLMDWIRFSTSGKDMTGIGGRLIKVREDEMNAHAEKDNAWTILNGKVYNVAPYMEYHPGGELELMRAAGTDGTKLFNDIHPWVNHESMLKTCMVGHFIGSRSKLREARKSETFDDIGSESNEISLTELGIGVESRWKESHLNLQIKHRWHSIRNEHVLVELLNENKCLRILLRPPHKEEPVELLWEFSKSSIKKIVNNLDTRAERFVIELGFENKISYNFAQNCTARLKPERQYRNAVVKSIKKLNHDSILVKLQLPPNCVYSVPCGHHVYLQACINGVITSRPYTPVVSNLSAKSVDEYLILLIKIYKNGFFTSWLHNLKPGSHIALSDPAGMFDVDRLGPVQNLCMLAAGTGLTPMLKLIKHWISLNKHSKPFLMIFNKTLEDVYFMDQLQALEADDKLDLLTVLSEPKQGWNGAKGRVKKQLLDSNLPHNSTDTLVTVCGPQPFTETTLELLDKLGWSDTQVHLFQG